MYAHSPVSQVRRLHTLNFCYENSAVKPTILILSHNTYNKRAHIECSVWNDNSLKSFAPSLGTYFKSTFIIFFNFFFASNLTSTPIPKHFYLIFYPVGQKYELYIQVYDQPSTARL